MAISPLNKLEQAQEHLRNGDAARARSLCKQILLRAPRNPDALCLLGMTHLMDGSPRAAVPLFEQALSVEPRHGIALEHLGLAQLMLDRFAEAERTLRKATAISGAPASV